MTDREGQVEQIAAHSRELAAALERQAAALADLVGRIDSLEARLGATQSAQQRSAERLERATVELDRGPELQSLADQMTALRGSQTQTAEHVERIAAQLGEIGRLDAAIRHLRDEMGARTETGERALRAEIATVAGKQAGDVSQLVRELHALRERVDELAPVQERITALDRRQSEETGARDRLSARIDELAGEKAEILEVFRRLDRHVEARIAGLDERVEEAGAEVATWRARLDATTEVVREARGVAEAMRAETDRIAEAHHATAEAERLFEDRVLALVADVRHDMERALEQMGHAWDQRWSALADANAERDRAVARLASDLTELAGRLERLDAVAAERSREQAVTVEALRRDVAAVLGRWHDALGAGIDIVEGALPEEERSAEAAERRDAVRRSLRAIRDRPER